MKDWKAVQSTAQPSEVEAGLSPTTVYLRRNITKTEIEGMDGETCEYWNYEEKELTTDEYNSMLMLEEIVSESNNSVVDAVTEFQKETVIDEYTESLIESGIL